MKSEKQIEDEIKNSIVIEVKNILDTDGTDHLTKNPCYIQAFLITVYIPAMKQFQDIGAWNEGKNKFTMINEVRLREDK